MTMKAVAMSGAARAGLAACAFVFGALAANGDVAVFPNADGSGDLASAAAWGDVAHGSDADVELKTANAQYTSSADLQFYSISWTKPCTIDLSSNPNTRVRLIGPSNGTPALFPGGTRASQNPFANDCGLMRIKGGIWDLGGVGVLRSVKDYNRARDSQLLIEGGAVVTNTRGVQVAYHATKNSMMVRDGSRVYDGGNARLRDGGATYSLFEVSGGSYYEFQKGNLNLANGGSYNTNLVCGSGTIFTNRVSDAVVFSKAKLSEVIFTDHAKVYLSSFYYGQEDAASNNFEVSRGAFLRTSGAMYVNYGNSAFANNLRILDGGVYSNANSVLIRGCGQSEVVVSNGTLACNEFKFDTSTCTGNVIRIIGPNAVFAPRTFRQFFQMGGWNRFVFDGCDWSHGGMYCGGNDSGTNRLELVNGARVTLSGAFRFENYSAGVNGQCSNTVFVGERCELTAQNFLFNGRDNALVVSNGTFTATGASQSLMLSEASASAPASGNRRVMQGTRPRLRGGATAYFRNDSILEFDVPPSGYDLDEPLMSVQSVTDDGTTEIRIEGDFKAWCKKLIKGLDVTLVEATGDSGTVGFSSAAVAAASAALPYGCRLSKSDDGKRLILHVASLVGTKIMFK